MGGGDRLSLTLVFAVSRGQSDQNLPLSLCVKECAALCWALAPRVTCLCSTFKQPQELGHLQVLNLQRDRRPETLSSLIQLLTKHLSFSQAETERA